jgi:ABC-2 type transport system permease protein
MRALRPPGWLWLLRHEVRLEWRAFGGGAAWILIGLGGLLYIAAHLAAGLIIHASPPERWLAVGAPAMILIEVVAATLVLSSAFGLAVRTLFFRGDLDLLLSAPVSATTVFAVRALFVAAGCIALLALLASPFIDMGILLGHPGMATAYAVIAALGLACAAIAFATTLVLGRILGVRRARVVAQILGALIGAIIVIAFQIPNLLPREKRAAFYASFAHGGHGWLGADSPLAWPLRAALGEPLPALVVIGGGLAVFLAMLPLNRRAFIDAVQRAGETGASAAAPAARAGGAHRAFRTGLARIVLVKELKLLARDPMLIGNSLLQMLYLVPLLVLAWSNRAAPQLVGAALILLLANLCGNLAWICVSAEEAPDLLGSAPIDRWRVNLYKACAAALAPALFGIPLVAWYALRSLPDAVIVAACLVLALLSSATIQLWHAKPARARDLAVRRKENVTTNLVEMVVAFGWAGTCFALLVHSFTAILGVLVALGGLLFVWASRTRPQ